MYPCCTGLGTRNGFLCMDSQLGPPTADLENASVPDSVLPRRRISGSSEHRMQGTALGPQLFHVRDTIQSVGLGGPKEQNARYNASKRRRRPPPPLAACTRLDKTIDKPPRQVVWYVLGTTMDESILKPLQETQAPIFEDILCRLNWRDIRSLSLTCKAMQACVPVQLALEREKGSYAWIQSFHARTTPNYPLIGPFGERGTIMYHILSYADPASVQRLRIACSALSYCKNPSIRCAVDGLWGYSAGQDATVHHWMG